MKNNWMPKTPCTCKNVKREEIYCFERWGYVLRRELAGGDFRKYLRTGKGERDISGTGFSFKIVQLLER
jgi:hypothetical protein